ncbi:MAG: hypothetical protein ABFD75_02070 [Smithella sp.]
MLKQWITGSDLLQRPIWENMSVHDVAELILNDKLPAYNQDHTPTIESILSYYKDFYNDEKMRTIVTIRKMTGHFDLDKEIAEVKAEITSDLIDVTPNLLFKLKEVEEFEKHNGIIQQEDAGEINRSISERLRKNLSENGQKGGKASKINKPILEATIQFLKEKPERLENSADTIFKAFKKKYSSEEKQCEIIMDGVDYGIYYTDSEIHSKAYKKKDTPLKTITLNTFKSIYISKAKKQIKASQS